MHDRRRAVDRAGLPTIKITNKITTSLNLTGDEAETKGGFSRGRLRKRVFVKMAHQSSLFGIAMNLIDRLVEKSRFWGCLKSTLKSIFSASKVDFGGQKVDKKGATVA